MRCPNLTPRRMFSALSGLLTTVVAALPRRDGRTGLAAAVLVGPGVDFILGGQVGPVAPPSTVLPRSITGLARFLIWLKRRRHDHSD
jgi:hypothetical protein